MDRVITAKDLATRERLASVRDRIQQLAARYGHKYVQDRPAGKPVIARIDFGRWLGDCECGGAEYVDPDEPIFFCCSCGNAGVNGRVRTVIFPENREAVEILVMSRPVQKMGGVDKIDQQMKAVPVGQPRNWKRGE